jgi:hypothetical protein
MYSIPSLVPLKRNVKVVLLSWEFKFISSYGLRVYVDNESVPRADNWKSASGTGLTFAYTASGTGVSVKFEVQFNNFKTDAGIGQTLLALWKIRGSSTWQELDSSFYQDYSAQPVVVDSNDVQKLSLLYVGKNEEELNTSTYGASSNDQIVIRSK